MHQNYPAQPNQGTSLAAAGVGASRCWRLARAHHQQAELGVAGIGSTVLQPPFSGLLPAKTSHPWHGFWFSPWKLLQEHRLSAGRQHFAASPALHRGTSSLSWA